MIRLAAAALLCLTAALLGAAADPGPVGVSATLRFRDGQVVRAIHFGGERGIEECGVDGYRGEQRVFYPLAELREVQFARAGAGYTGAPADEVVVVGKDGARGTLARARFRQLEPPPSAAEPRVGSVRYVSIDPVTKTRKTATAECGALAAITMGDDTGRRRRNAKTGQFFPTAYAFDPYTGEALEWTDEKP
jgi:hypothetical protein